MPKLARVAWILPAVALACNGDSGTSDSASSTSDAMTVTVSSTTGMTMTASATETTTTTVGPTGTMSASMTNATTDMTVSTTAGTGDGVCGNGIVEMGEECDNAQDNGSGQECLANCLANVCGDDDKGPGEECDDGDANAAMGVCKEDCTLNVCGDGQVGPGEGCDDGNNNDNDSCKNDCSAPSCGDGIVDVEQGEDCDDGNDNDEDGCLNTCKFPPSPCGTQAFEATLEVAPVDIIISIDNSGSMGQEIEGVEQNINDNFAQIIEDSGLDYRVILVSEHGESNGPESICIEAPLSGIQQGGCDPPPPDPVNNPPIFYHFSVPISSHNMFCQLIRYLHDGQIDQDGQNAYKQFLREDSVKSFIGISDDGISCSWNGYSYSDGNNANNGLNAGQQWLDDMRMLEPKYFEKDGELNITYYSLVAMAYNNPPEAPYPPEDPIILGECPGAADAGTGHQGASKLSEGLRFPLCNPNNYDVLFQEIAQGVIEGSSVACEFPVPMPEPPDEIDLSSIEIDYTPMGMGEPIPYQQVPTIDDCGPEKFYIQGDTVYLCPEACDAVQDDFDAQLDLEYQCLPDIG